MMNSSMNETQPLWVLSATELVAGYLARRFTPLGVIESVLDRIDGVNPLLNALVTCDEAGARSAAVESARRYCDGKPLSRIDGVPITVKDNIPVMGMRSTWGSRLFSDYIPEKDELPIARFGTRGLSSLGRPIALNSRCRATPTTSFSARRGTPGTSQ